MDSRNFLLDLEIAVQEKKLERSMLMEKKERMLADFVNGEILFAHFMAFIEAVENEDPDITLKFDETAMKDSAFTILNNFITYSNSVEYNDGAAAAGAGVDIDGEDSDADAGEN